MLYLKNSLLTFMVNIKRGGNRFTLSLLLVSCIALASLPLLRSWYIQGGQTVKKHVVIFSSKGGGGHTAVSNALKECLDDTYRITIAHTFSEVLSSLDFLGNLTNGRVGGVNMYNKLIGSRASVLINLCYPIGRNYYLRRKKTITKILIDYLRTQKADAVISDTPLVNGPLLDAAQELGIPFLMMPIDLDPTTFTFGIIDPDYKNFYCLPVLNEPRIIEKLESKGIHKRSIQPIGASLRRAFVTPKNKTVIKKEWDIPEDKPVILMLFGSVGSKSLLNYAQELQNLESPAHLVMCLGRAEHARKELEKLEFPAHITTTFVGFTDKIPDLMACADILISKSGSVSVCEGIYMNLPTLLDATGNVLPWEQFNHEFMHENGFGHSVKKLKDIVPLVEQTLKDAPAITKKMAAAPKPDGCENVKMLLEALLKDFRVPTP